MRIATMLLGLASLLSYTPLFTQITLTASDLPQVGDTVVIATDTMVSGMGPGPAGPDQVWDFSDLQADETYLNVFLEVAAGPDSDSFPDADFLLLTNDIYSYADITADALLLLGGSFPEAALFGISSLRLDDPQQLFALPSTYGTTFMDEYGITITVDGEIINPLIDSIRLVQHNTSNVTIDAHGTLTTPLGTVEALRQRTELTTVDSIFTLFLGNWSLFEATTTTIENYIWLAAEARGEVLSLTVGEDGNVSNVDFAVDLQLTGALAPIASFAAELTAGNTLQFTDRSQNEPVSWSWDFGDGNVSTDQNPQHMYATAGEYEVCLQVTNANGTSTTCQNVVVVAAPQAAFTFTDEGSGQVSFMDQSTNNPNSWLWDFGDGSTSTDQNPSHTFTADSTYEVCLTIENLVGVDQSCEMVAVVISALDERFGQIDFTVLPNPMHEFLRFTLNSDQLETFELSLLNAVGQTVRHSTFQNQITWSVIDLPVGTYYYRLLSIDGKVVASGQVVKVE